MKNLLRILLSITVLFVVATIAVIVCRSALVLQYGIPTYNSIRTILLIVTALLCFASGILFAVKAYQMRDDTETSYSFEDSALTEKQRQKVLADFLLCIAKKWKYTSVATYSREIIKQQAEIDEYQMNLTELIKMNGSDEISDSKDMVQRIEDCMYVNIKKLLNYMYSMNRSDEHFVTSKVKECTAKNALLYGKAKEFVISVTDYVNRANKQDDRSLYVVQSYKETILDMLDGTEAYLT